MCTINFIRTVILPTLAAVSTQSRIKKHLIEHNKKEKKKRKKKSQWKELPVSQKHFCSSVIITFGAHPAIFFTFSNDISIKPIPDDSGMIISRDSPSSILNEYKNNSTGVFHHSLGQTFKN